MFHYIRPLIIIKVRCWPMIMWIFCSDVTLQWRCPWCWNPITWPRPPTYERCASASSLALFSFHEPTQTKELRLRFPLSDASIVIIVLFCEDSRFCSGLDWQWVTTTRPAWKIHFTASWNISVRRFKRPTPSWKRTWRLLEMIGFTGGWEVILICNWANYCVI